MHLHVSGPVLALTLLITNSYQFIKIAELIQISNVDHSFSAVSKYSSDTRKRVTQFGAKHKGSLSPRDNGENQKN